ncbi:MAG: hypothetical protein ACRYGM_08975 [Janthinobacterium lividum]
MVEIYPHSNHATALAAAAVIRAVRLDRLADAELQQGHHATAEHLARIAATMRENAQ